MLRWVIKEVDSPYGSVATLHWAVVDDNNTNNENDYYNKDKSEQKKKSNYNNSDGVEASIALATDEAETLLLEQQLETAEDQLGAVLWNSNTVALKYLQEHVLQPHNNNNNNNNNNKSVYRIVELGAGVGCLGIALAMGGARVVITDLKELLPLMQKNIELNKTRIKSRSNGVGACSAIAWRWGPPPRPKNNKNKNKQQKQKQIEENKLDISMKNLSKEISPYTVPSPSFIELQKILDCVDFVILCDALYGNPKDWPQLLYTLSEILVANPSCEIINFCEQRINDVEGDFIRLLEEENKKKLSPSENIELVANEDETMDLALTRMRGKYKWFTSTEVVSEGSSDLDMIIRATRIRWVLPKRKRCETSLLNNNNNNTSPVNGSDNGKKEESNLKKRRAS